MSNPFFRMTARSFSQMTALAVAGILSLLAAPAAGTPAGQGIQLAQAPGASTGSSRPSRDVHQELEQADVELRAAEKALEDARRRLAEGEEPLPGERTGIAGSGGRSRLNEAYFKRQEELKKAVEAAQRRLEQAQARRNAVRG